MYIIMLKIFSEGLKYAPKLNAHISYNKDTKEGEIRTIENINVNMPWILPSGKMMTITISNIGSTYREQRGTISMLDIIPPQVCVIGFGAIQEKPGVYTNEQGEKTIGIRKILPICIAFDHRALDFGEVIPFIKKLDSIFENPDIIGEL